MFGQNGEPVYPLISMETVWLLAIKVKGKLYVLDEEKIFSKSVAPLLDMKPTDITYINQKFTADDTLPFSVKNMENALNTLSRGYSESKQEFFGQCLGLIFGLTIRGVVYPKMKSFVSSVLAYNYSGSGIPPPDVTSAFGHWSIISKWYLNGCEGDLNVGRYKLKSGCVKSVIALVNSKSGASEEKDTRKHGPPKPPKRAPWNGPAKDEKGSMRAK